MVKPSDDLNEATKCLTSDPDRSLELCEQYLEHHPDDTEGLFRRFQAWEELCEFENALADINRVVEKEPIWLNYLARGVFFHKFGHYERAVNDLTRVGELDTEGRATTFGAWFRANSLARLGRLDEALGYCTFLSDDHWIPAFLGLPPGNKEEFIEEIKRRAALARSRKT